MFLLVRLGLRRGHFFAQRPRWRQERTTLYRITTGRLKSLSNTKIQVPYRRLKVEGPVCTVRPYGFMILLRQRIRDTVSTQRFAYWWPWAWATQRADRQLELPSRARTKIGSKRHLGDALPKVLIVLLAAAAAAAAAAASAAAATRGLGVPCTL